MHKFNRTLKDEKGMLFDRQVKARLAFRAQGGGEHASRRCYGLCRNSNEHFFDLACLLSFCSITNRFFKTANGISKFWTSSDLCQRLAKLAIDWASTLER